MSIYSRIQHQRSTVPEWPGSLLIEAGSGHFDCTETMAGIIGQYIFAASRARLPHDGNGPLRPVDLDSGYVVGLPVPREPLTVRYKDCPESARNLPWYFDEQLAEAAYELADLLVAANTGSDIRHGGRKTRAFRDPRNRLANSVYYGR